MDTNLLNDTAVCIVVAWLLAVAAQLLKQPLVLAYLVAGYAVGPMGLRWIQPHSIETISEIGLILLLFMIGMEIDLKKVLSTGRLITVTAAAQILGGCLLGWILFVNCFPVAAGANLQALYLAIAMALSSTVIIVKILYDKRELDTLAGRISLGILVLQDLFAILFLAIQPNLRDPSATMVLLSLGKVLLIMGAAFAASRYVLPPLFRAVARLPELVLVGALAWCFLVAGLASFLDLSREMGALIAGVAISTFPYALDVTAKVTSLRDFFVTLFFVGLGMAIPAPTFNILGWAGIVALFLMVSRFLTVFPLLYWLRQGHRVGLLVSLQLSQVSEFSLVILALGLQAKHIDQQAVGIISYTFVFLAVASSYAIAKSDALIPRLCRVLVKLGVPDLDQKAPAELDADNAPSVFFLGFFWTASSLLEELQRRAPEILRAVVVIDFNPEVYARLRQRGIQVVYGDISRRETLAHAGIAHAKVIVCTLPNMILKGTDNLRLLQQLRQLNATAQIIVHAETLPEVPKLYAAGADYVTVPRLLEAVDLCAAIQAAHHRQLPEKRAELDRELAARDEVIP